MSKIHSFIASCLFLTLLLTACTQNSPSETPSVLETSGLEQEIVPSSQDLSPSEPNTLPEAEGQEKAETALVFPNPCSAQFDLSQQDAALFDAAVAAKNRTPDSSICIPEIAIYGTYEDEGQTIVVCQVYYRFYYGCDGTETYTDYGAMQAPAKAVLTRDSAGTLQCISFTLAPDGAGTVDWAEDFCGPLTELRDYFLSPDPDAEWPLTDTMPSSEELFHDYICTYKKYV